MVAEYQPSTSQYYYYMSDQINSTRMVTDDSGAVVYSAAYDPYGGIQQTWVNSFDPMLKFSGKERDGESGLDYFGARYYDKSLYRFLNVDPKINIGRALRSPICWNQYAYCHNNPITFIDPDGRDEQHTIYVIRTSKNTNSTLGYLYYNGQYCGRTWELPWNNDRPFLSCVPEGTYIGYLHYRTDLQHWVIEFNEPAADRWALQFHPSGDLNEGCIETMDSAAYYAAVDSIYADAVERGIEETTDSRGNRYINILISIRIDFSGYYWYHAFDRLEMIGRQNDSPPIPQGTVTYTVSVKY